MVETTENSSNRKHQHLALTNSSQTSELMVDERFNYEPMLSNFSFFKNFKASKFLGKEMRAPIWISSMTGGTGDARYINENLATVASEFGLGMGLGSCRQLLTDQTYFEDFNLRPRLTDALPFYANLGIAQVEQLLKNNDIAAIEKLVTSLSADGVIVHINPLQEWFQPEGDIIEQAPIDTVKKLLELTQIPVIIKEVGQGLGPKSLESLMCLPLAAIEFAAFGGTNFALMEKQRNSSDLSTHEELSFVGHTALEMVEISNEIIDRLGDKVLCKNFIISGGIRSYLDGYYLISLSKGNAVFGMASPFLNSANEGIDKLRKFTAEMIRGLEVASRYLSVKE
ncbi:type 2 isopentenyl-diphosphate Delta-isomerase [Bacteriovorax sp. Seq25_V]|uniref:type 2 isopentenyl-diphosphate Delta-isomerase n=1 Tax=Bacteriovorax sp. Seq25_V TaxID=1201288 RepID=UPI00038A0A5C|nr:type 2 isopentenyl-diphosphate Delta-isomerase [Bacteriovorax sp. Seq25_V]EQC44914.1 putative isopentenyl-diphosphate delta-isomerase, type 2 [Bacteriovorax sp. Seq25_V]